MYLNQKRFDDLVRRVATLEQRLFGATSGYAGEPANALAPVDRVAGYLNLLRALPEHDRHRGYSHLTRLLRERGATGDDRVMRRAVDVLRAEQGRDVDLPPELRVLVRPSPPSGTVGQRPSEAPPTRDDPVPAGPPPPPAGWERRSSWPPALPASSSVLESMPDYLRVPAP